MKKINLLLQLSFTLLFATVIRAQDAETPPTPFETKIFQMNDRILADERLQVGGLNPDSIPSLPVGLVRKIGNTVYCIAIDSAVFEHDKAYFSAYMALDFPGAHRKIAFAAKHVTFNPSGILASEGVKLQLVSDNLIHLGPKLDLFLKGDGSNYIEFDCNGYKRARIKGEFRFKGDLLEPTTAGAEYVTATVDVIVEDLQNLYAAVTFSPFQVKGLEDYKFAVSEATVDLSDFQNPNATLPLSFTQEFGAQDINLWRGFYLKNLTITLPRKISNKNGSNTQVGLNDLFIDNSGATGQLFANNVLATNNGDMSGWGFSITRIELGFQSNVLVNGKLKGVISVAPMDDNDLSYIASITTTATDVDYNFTIGITDTIGLNISALNSRITILPNSTLNVNDNNPEDKFIPTLVLNGKWTIRNGKTSIDRVTFSALTVTTQSPFLIGGVFALTNDGGVFANFPISIDQISLSYTQTTQKLILGTLFSLNIGSDNIDFAAACNFNIYCKTDFTGNDNFHLQFERIDVGAITIDIQTSPFDLQGTIIFKDDDPVFGKLFFGSIYFRLNSIMDEFAVLRAGFGKTATVGNVAGYKYWFVDGQVPVNIQMGQISITKIIGGASYHVASSLSQQDLIGKVKETLDPNAAIPFTPNIANGLAFKAGVGFKHTVKESIVNGDAMLGVYFNNNGGFDSISLLGNCFMLVDIAHRFDENVKNKIHGKVWASYDRNTSTFHTTIDATAEFGGAIEGSLHTIIHIDPNNWYVWFNRPGARATLNLLRNDGSILLTAGAYLMFGTSIDPLPALPVWAQNISSVSNSRSVDVAAAGSGNGLVTGMNIHTDLGREYLVDQGSQANYYVYLQILIDLGFDLMVMKYPDNAVCSQTGNSFGMNQRYCSGQLYFKADIAAGGKRVNRKNGNQQNAEIFSLQLLALLQGQFPKPTFLAGDCQGTVKFLGLNLGTYNFHFDLGSQCSIIY